MEPIRVLHILHSMNRGGAENAIMNYYRHIDRDKVQFDFLLTASGKCHFEDEILGLGGRVFRIPLLKILNPFSYVKALSGFFRDHPEYRIVHSHTSSKSFVPLLIAKRAGIKVRISHSHNSKSEEGIRGRIRNAMKLPLLWVATDYCACGEEAAKWLYGDKVFESGKVHIVPNVIDACIFSFSQETRANMRSFLGISESTFVIGNVARFFHQKNHDFIVSVFDSLHKKYVDSKLLLVGDGELREEIENKVRDLGIDDSVIFVGSVPNVADYEQAMDVFLLPSFNEGIPLSLIEAQVAGLCCFASEGVPRESDKTGLVSFLPLEKGADYWASRVLECHGDPRTSRVDDIVKSGYDAPTSARCLQAFYQDLYTKAK
ncbi:MAG: glycosyltransferase family 1 protein [Bacteroidales bacterium]|nr:glycosyltransferase family 1 protein [Bacteroidales bacterium]